MFFCNEMREKLKRENPGTAITEVGKDAGRAKYEKMQKV